MAKFQAELPNDLIKVFDELETDAEIMMGEMCKAGATVVYNKVVSGLGRAFKSTDSLLKGLKITKVYETPSDEGINVHVGFYGRNDYVNVRLNRRIYRQNIYQYEQFTTVCGS